MIGTQAALGVGASTDVLLFVICSPVGPYYKTGFKPVSLLATTKDVRAWPGGTGGFKVGWRAVPKKPDQAHILTYSASPLQLGSNYAGGIVRECREEDALFESIRLQSAS